MLPLFLLLFLACRCGCRSCYPFVNASVVLLYTKPVTHYTTVIKLYVCVRTIHFHLLLLHLHNAIGLYFSCTVYEESYLHLICCLQFVTSFISLNSFCTSAKSPVSLVASLVSKSALVLHCCNTSYLHQLMHL